MKSILTAIILITSFQVHASRLVEIEDYYVKKTSDFIKMRYPRAAFSVYVTVEAENKPQLRQPASNSDSYLNLPYLNPVNANDISFWDRQDVSLGTLISYLRSVNIKVDIDRSFSSSQRDVFKTELFKYLKLSDTFDRLEVTEKVWSGESLWKKWQAHLMLGLLGFLGVAVAFFLIFQNGVSRLVKGLSQPLSEIGKSAENVANSSQLPVDIGSGTSAQWSEGVVSAQDLSKVKEEITRLSSYISDPDADLLYKLEELGARDAGTMGSIFGEMPVEDLKKLVVWSKGEWWRLALTEMSPISQKSQQFLNEISHLYIRRNLLAEKIDVQLEELKRFMARLSTKQFGELFSNKKFKEVEGVLRLLPQETKIQVGKYLYPGQWAELLTDKKVDVSAAKQSEFIEHCKKLCPLKTEKEIFNYFQEADLQSLLDRSSTKDEREIYKALPESSWIKKHRLPFYSLFQDSEAVIEKLSTDLPLELWSLVMLDCDQKEMETVYSHFTSKQKFMMRGLRKRYQERRPSDFQKVQAKKRIMLAWKHIKQQIQIAEESKSQNEVAV